jgi:hypothetical protein
MKRQLFGALLFFPFICSAQSIDLAGVPQNCEAPMAHEMEMSNIPAVLDLGDNAARIIDIHTMSNTQAYQYYPKLYRLDCYLIVKWSNGATDYGYKFSAWENKYGQTMVSYGRHN